MKISKTKNGFLISVQDWSNEVVITDKKTKKIIKKMKFNDHIKAVLVAKAL